MTLLPGLKIVPLSGILKRLPISDASNNVKPKKPKGATQPTRDSADDLNVLWGAINTLYERLKESFIRKSTLPS